MLQDVDHTGYLNCAITYDQGCSANRNGVGKHPKN